jgi:bifunctional ADP-heptose synthase (sugar kinase/adenylyltransferase)
MSNLEEKSRGIEFNTLVKIVGWLMFHKNDIFYDKTTHEIQILGQIFLSDYGKTTNSTVENMANLLKTHNIDDYIELHKGIYSVFSIVKYHLAKNIDELKKLYEEEKNIHLKGA